MKHKFILTSVAAVLIPGATFAWNVSTTPTHQSALIEEFTGIHCPNCPDGHRMAAEISAIHPEVHSVAIHAGGYAEHRPSEPDFVTAVGTAIHGHFEASSYPSGVVSRQQTRYGLVIGRSDWGGASRDVMQQTSPVNIWSSASYDEATRTVTLDVECYFTYDMTDPRINVMMLQSEILGPQSGGQLGNEYPHRHMLRARLTDNDLGDVIDKKTKGEYWSRQFVYTIPTDINSVPVDPRNVEFLSFVTEGADNVRTLSSARLETPGMDPVFSVGTTAAPLAIKNYAFDYIETFVHNYGTEPVTSAKFSVTINGERSEHEWTGNIAPHTSRLVRVPLDGTWTGAVDSESNRYSYKMTEANGKEVDCAPVSGTFNEIAQYPAKLNVMIKTDLDAADNTWRILDGKGEVIREFGPYENGKVEEYQDNVELEEGKIYCLEVFDAWGDGVCHPLGSLKMTDAEGNPVSMYREIRGYGMRQFFRTVPAQSGVPGIQGAEGKNIEYYDLSGRRVARPVPGVTIMRITGANGAVKIQKIIK